MLVGALAPLGVAIFYFVSYVTNLRIALDNNHLQPFLDQSIRALWLCFASQGLLVGLLYLLVAYRPHTVSRAGDRAVRPDAAGRSCAAVRGGRGSTRVSLLLAVASVFVLFAALLWPRKLAAADAVAGAGPQRTSFLTRRPPRPPRWLRSSRTILPSCITSTRSQWQWFPADRHDQPRQLEPGDGGADQAFGAQVQVAGRFIEEQQPRPAVQRARQHDPLASARRIASCPCRRSGFRNPWAWRRSPHAPQPGVPRLHALLVLVGIEETDVLGEAAGEELVVLHHRSRHAAQGARPEPLQVMATDADGSRRRVAAGQAAVSPAWSCRSRRLRQSPPTRRAGW